MLYMPCNAQRATAQFQRHSSDPAYGIHDPNHERTARMPRPHATLRHARCAATTHATLSVTRGVPHATHSMRHHTFQKMTSRILVRKTGGVSHAIVQALCPLVLSRRPSASRRPCCPPCSTSQPSPEGECQVLATGTAVLCSGCGRAVAGLLAVVRRVDPSKPRAAWGVLSGHGEALGRVPSACVRCI